MSMRTHRTLPAVIALALLACACSRSPRASFYTLVPAAAPRVQAPAGTSPAVSVGPVTLPELVDRPQLVVRVAQNRVEVLETHRWAEPLKSEIPRLMARDLGRLLGSDRVSSYGQSAAADAGYRVLVDVVRFEPSPGDSVALEALWSVRRPGGEKRRGRSLVQEKVTGAGYEPLVAACSRALALVSADIADAIRAEAVTGPGKAE